MGRPKGSANKKGKVAYPRKCEYCEYVSNNPSMYHYHKKTHAPIPDGQMCEHGCNQPAKYLGTGGVYTCLENAHRCPAYLEKHKKRVTEQWVGANERKQQTKDNIYNSILSEESIRKSRIASNQRAIIKADDAKDYRAYARKCRKLAQQWAKDNGYEIGRQTFHVDHKLSVADAYNAKLDIEVVNHPANLQILSASDNVAKWAHSGLTVDELYEEINRWSNWYECNRFS